MKMSEVHAHLFLRLLGTALIAAGPGLADPGQFDAVPANTCCTARNISVAARGETECAMKCEDSNSSLSFSFINGVCILSDSVNCAPSGPVYVYKKRSASYSETLSPTIHVPPAGYTEKIGDRTFWVFQQRQTGTGNFNRTWTEYEQGFGDVCEFWSGLKSISNFTQSSNNKTLRIEATMTNGTFYVMEWLNFTVAGASTNYTMNCGAHVNSNNSFDVLQTQRGMKFSTIDRDNDLSPDSCSAFRNGGGFWFNNCFCISPNGAYSTTALTGTNALNYMNFYSNSNFYTLRKIRMMLQV